MKVLYHFLFCVCALLLPSCTHPRSKQHLNDIETHALKLLNERNADSLKKALILFNFVLKQDEEHHYNAYLNKAIIFNRLNCYHEALEEFKTYRIAKKNFENKDFDGILFMAFGKQHELLGDTTSAWNFYKRSINMLRLKFEHSRDSEDLINYIVSYRQCFSYKETLDEFAFRQKDLKRMYTEKDLIIIKEILKDRNFPFKDLIE